MSMGVGVSASTFMKMELRQFLVLDVAAAFMVVAEGDGADLAVVQPVAVGGGGGRRRDFGRIVR